MLALVILYKSECSAIAPCFAKEREYMLAIKPLEGIGNYKKYRCNAWRYLLHTIQYFFVSRKAHKIEVLV